MPLARSAEDTAAQQTKQKKKDDKNLKQQHDMFCLCLSVVYDRHIIYIYTHTHDSTVSSLDSPIDFM